MSEHNTTGQERFRGKEAMSANADVKDNFSFTPQMLEKAKAIIAKYPVGKQASAVIPLLDLAQRQHNNWLPQGAMDYVADLLDMPRIRVYEVATFYSMYNLKPVGEFFVQVCTTTPCWLRGSDEVLAACEQYMGIKAGQTRADGKFTLVEVECLGACVNAPMLQINDHYYEDLTPQTTQGLLAALERGETPAPGPQNGRQTSTPYPADKSGVKDGGLSLGVGE
jgi:NADH-quinone oxidoreductase E subunit